MSGSAAVERWHRRIDALVDHRDKCSDCRPGGQRCRVGKLLHEAEQMAYRLAQGRKAA